MRSDVDIRYGRVAKKQLKERFSTLSTGYLLFAVFFAAISILFCETTGLWRIFFAGLSGYNLCYCRRYESLYDWGLLAPLAWMNYGGSATQGDADEQGPDDQAKGPEKEKDNHE